MKIDKNEVLRYLGWRGQAVSGELDRMIGGVIEQCESAARPKSIWRVFSVVPFQEGIILKGSSLLLTGHSIAEHLRGADRAAVMACTLGHEIDRHIRKLSYTDMTRSAVFDAAATVLTESFCDGVSLEIAAEAERDGYGIGSRFSPGYGDLPLELQPKILAVLDAARAMGLTATSSNMMIPSKSVTAVVGLFRGGRGQMRLLRLRGLLPGEKVPIL